MREVTMVIKLTRSTTLKAAAKLIREERDSQQGGTKRKTSVEG